MKRTLAYMACLVLLGDACVHSAKKNVSLNTPFARSVHFS